MIDKFNKIIKNKSFEKVGSWTLIQLFVTPEMNFRLAP